jgi:hypothetical protein
MTTHPPHTADELPPVREMLDDLGTADRREVAELVERLHADAL